MKKKILYLVFTFNFLFSLLTAILPLIVFSITNSSATSGYVMTVFMVSLLTVRFILFYKYVEPILLNKFGVISYCLGFLLLVFYYDQIIAFYIGSVFLGVGVGVVGPILLTMLTDASSDKKAVSYHNMLMALASATGPVLGVYMLNKLKENMYPILFAMGATMVIVSFLFGKGKVNEEKSESNELNLKAIILNKDYASNLLIFLISSINYGCIIAYLPILLDINDLRIDYFYLAFWICFVLAQIFVPRLGVKFKLPTLLYLFLFVLSVSIMLIGYAGSYWLLLPLGGIFGFGYGALMNVFYSIIAAVNEQRFKADAYSLFGIMSYVGVGIGAFLFSPLAEKSLSLIFVISGIITVVVLIAKYLVDFINIRKKVNGKEKEKCRVNEQ
ncbi:MFS transporter [Aquibacillus sp. 3ASR75-11]|uniref:MFS transporter n=1 Tax=Terrihalobacillus insolitus TaxID=2950438 RepID=A0A9X3WVT1_9BACI|nr:MFS transporter [Terrihalobacillus insolitus]MDC3425121.1 MFS transporter [Terrihalobacillus insolitus]